LLHVLLYHLLPYVNCILLSIHQYLFQGLTILFFSRLHDLRDNIYVFIVNCLLRGFCWAILCFTISYRFLKLLMSGWMSQIFNHFSMYLFILPLLNIIHQLWHQFLSLSLWHVTWRPIIPFKAHEFNFIFNIFDSFLISNPIYLCSLKTCQSVVEIITLFLTHLLFSIKVILINIMFSLPMSMHLPSFFCIFKQSLIKRILFSFFHLLLRFMS
jgi:hypothetical protein